MWKYGICGMTLVGIVCAVLVVVNMNAVVDEPSYEPGWHTVYTWTPLGEEAASTGGTQWLGIYFVNHTATPNSAYDTNSSDDLSDWANTTFGAGKGYGTADEFYLELKHSTTFDIVVRVVYNQTWGPWTGSAWDNASWRVNITLTGDITITDVTGVNVETDNDSGKAHYWGNCYWDNSGSGYTLGADDTAAIVEISIEAKY